MILIVKNANNGRQFDRVELTEKDVKYETGTSRDIVENKIAHYGLRGAMDVLRSWSNGYVIIEEE